MDTRDGAADWDATDGEGGGVMQMDDAERSDLAAKRVAVLRPYQWQPGTSGNPHGKAAGFAARVRREKHTKVGTSWRS